MTKEERAECARKGLLPGILEANTLEALKQVSRDLNGCCSSEHIQAIDYRIRHFLGDRFDRYQSPFRGREDD